MEALELLVKIDAKWIVFLGGEHSDLQKRMLNALERIPEREVQNLLSELSARRGGDSLIVDLLKFLAERPGLALSRQQILDGVWGFDWFGDARTVDVHIAQVRKKLASAVRIDTVRGVGYRLDPK